jgi:hypothetical protein
MTFPHPESGKEKGRNEDKASREGVLGNLVEWTIDIAGYGDGKDDVNPAKN